MNNDNYYHYKSGWEAGFFIGALMGAGATVGVFYLAGFFA